LARSLVAGEGHEYGGAGDSAARNWQAAAAQAQAAASARELEARRARELLVEGEIVLLNPHPDAAASWVVSVPPAFRWSALRPRVGRSGDAFPPPGAAPVPGHGLLDSGNGAMTMINPETALAAGIHLDDSIGGGCYSC
jgi:hypothetical protein